MNPSDFPELRALARKRWVRGELSKVEYHEMLAAIDADEKAAQPPPRPPELKVDPYDGLSSLPSMVRPEFPAGPPQPVVGQLIGKYKLVSKLRGGMGVVWKAEDPKGERLVALKFLPPELLGNADEIARIRSTFRLVEQLNHDHICRVFDLDEHPQFGWYQVMRWIDGQTLSGYRRDASDAIRCLSVKEVAELLGPVAEALDYAHGRKVLHRDIKPQNIMRGEDSHVSVVDFGLAAEVRSSLTRVSQSAVDLAGTQPYLAPELWEGGYATPKTDQYALGLTAYELMAGRYPFNADNPLILMQAVLNKPIPVIEGLPGDAMAVLQRCLARNPAERFVMCRDFVVALKAGRLAPAPVVPVPAVSVEAVRKTGTVAAPAAVKETGKNAGSASQVRPGTKAGERTSFTLGGIEYAFRWCPAGKFAMGGDQASVELTSGFWMQETTVTQAMWRAVMGTQPWQGQAYTKEGPTIAVTYVNWAQATEFSEKLTVAVRQAGVLPGSSKIALPTEARWEYACCAGTTTAYSFGDDVSKLGDYAWFSGNAWSKKEKYAHAVGQKQANPWGLYDMHGNVQEWCQDMYGTPLPGGRDPLVTSGSSRVLRGGSWRSVPQYCRCSLRLHYDPTYRLYDIGFRVIMGL